eukprot:CAMPEP_0202453276 /NCGR_PEP_ID=MMETSP1360-20130828/11279_1 /ASSEMBLY_ACC=CAM_ASM_000848 /TAXON_ID=515479 /ORGANISM="Licmophora paradoxa, Strain CCMP2313" /LENGTH=328 /DNA_ID=CAMNT_0049072317 /DNA_START=129 /DNA_END=1115 /DNA_ORIENTATION=+
MSSNNKISNHENKKITPAVPEFRRMQIGTAPAMPTPVTMGINKAQVSTSFKTPPSLPQWNICATSIPMLDDFYPLEKTHAIIKGEDAQTVANRISHQFHSQSIAVSSDEHSCTVVLEDRTELVVQLFWEDQNLVVECQRIHGCRFTFRRLAKVTLQAAKGMAVAPNAAAASTKRPPVPPIPEPTSKSCHSEEALKLALQLIGSDRVDARELGCQSLLQLTTNQAGVSISKQQAQDILKQLPSIDPKISSKKSKSIDSYLRPVSLQILGNLLERAMVTDDLSKEMILSLQQDAQASSDPFTAHQAARCLEALRPVTAPMPPPLPPRPVC